MYFSTTEGKDEKYHFAFKNLGPTRLLILNTNGQSRPREAKGKDEPRTWNSTDAQEKVL